MKNKNFNLLDFRGLMIRPLYIITYGNYIFVSYMQTTFWLSQTAELNVDPGFQEEIGRSDNARTPISVISVNF